jgi:hypothetical protein
MKHLTSSISETGINLFYLLELSEELTYKFRGADKSLARPERKQARAIEDFEFHISYL